MMRPQDRERLFQRALFEFNQNNNEAATDLFSELLAVTLEDPLPPAYLAFICARQGQPEAARGFMALAEQADPARIDLKVALGESFLKHGQPEEALLYLEEAVSQRPDFFQAYPTFAEALRRTGRFEEAILLLQQSANIASPVQSVIQDMLLGMLAERADLTGLVQCCQRFSRGSADHLVAARCLARFDESGEQFLDALSRTRADWLNSELCGGGGGSGWLLKEGKAGDSSGLPF